MGFTRHGRDSCLDCLGHVFVSHSHNYVKVICARSRPSTGPERVGTGARTGPPCRARGGGLTSPTRTVARAQPLRRAGRAGGAPQGVPEVGHHSTEGPTPVRRVISALLGHVPTWGLAALPHPVSPPGMQTSVLLLCATAVLRKLSGSHAHSWRGIRLRMNPPCPGLARMTQISDAPWTLEWRPGH